MRSMTGPLRVLLQFFAIQLLVLSRQTVHVQAQAESNSAGVQIALAKASSVDPVLDGLLVSNAARAAEIDVEIPGFFNESAKGQHPKVRTCYFSFCSKPYVMPNRALF